MENSDLICMNGLPSSSSEVHDDETRKSFITTFSDAFATVENSSEVFDEIFYTLVGDVLSGKFIVEDAVKLLSSVDLSKSTRASISLVDTLWFWGSQVRGNTDHLISVGK